METNYKKLTLVVGILLIFQKKTDIVFKDKVTIQELIGIFISFFGIIIITTKGNITDFNLTSLQGDILALSGTFVFPLFSILGKKFNFDKIISVFIYFLSALIFIIPKSTFPYF
ncbi:MAG: hypothetical protein LKJ66_14180 [Clostridium luticellarii]|jgi:drug/metabolite transporter (DMT)-like permease|uniref:EamA-like transporter family protein n=1 Tax=Clostridium luticellarii TaxID=1691940 RepID=A0A2T0BSV3_9CLOT|nr:hypothetical protein [Clostridium luticellarii]MCI1946434.1 hypothetical protein [Clostridium luticellarii]MCI1996876.1 hypothetical protein [Clostridium luticellarii]MCI2041201.1 hypothetical protein [Clostridium luticellarii]PRR86895.1 hypothetical protein CLLU_00610 [Clostridium luticellarii]